MFKKSLEHGRFSCVYPFLHLRNALILNHYHIATVRKGRMRNGLDPIFQWYDGTLRWKRHLEETYRKVFFSEKLVEKINYFT